MKDKYKKYTKLYADMDIVLFNTIIKRLEIFADEFFAMINEMENHK